MSLTTSASLEMIDIMGLKNLYYQEQRLKCMKYSMIASLISISGLLTAQTMKWIPMTAGMATALCPIEKSKKKDLLCYALEYTPETSGILTSYTTAFFITCSTMGNPVVKNQSCSMTNNVNLINGCDGNGVVLMNSSGNSGSGANNLVTSGIPVILHQVCFSIPYGESITITEDQVTDLTTSIDLVNEDIITEYPTFTEITIYRKKYDISRPALLDFKALPVADFSSQLDWTTPEEANIDYFDLERCSEGTDFVVIGRVDTDKAPGRINSYQFLDKHAVFGNNLYRLRYVDIEGNAQYSPVRIVHFAAKTFSVKVSPNPADQYIVVEIQSPVNGSSIKLIDYTGQVVIDEATANNFLKARLETGKLNPGMYTVIVESGSHKFSDNIVIAH